MSCARRKERAPEGPLSKTRAVLAAQDGQEAPEDRLAFVKEDLLALAESEPDLSLSAFTSQGIGLLSAPAAPQNPAWIRRNSVAASMDDAPPSPADYASFYPGFQRKLSECGFKEPRSPLRRSAVFQRQIAAELGARGVTG